MKNAIYYIWKNSLLPLTGLHTTSGEKLRIIDHGQSNENSNVFNNAKLIIGDNTWVGNVVLHDKSSDWEQEIHADRSCTDNVILHVTMENDCTALRKHGEEIHQLCIGYPERVEKEFHDTVIGKTGCLPCAHAVSQIEEVKLHCILSRLLVERIEEKASGIMSLHARYGQKWEETLFRTLVRSFGFGIHSELFDELASILDFQALGKHYDNSIQVEAIFFGQAGLLDEESIPYYYRKSATESNYFKEIKREFIFLEKKFNLRRMDYKKWDACNSSPHLRIARLAATFHNRTFNMSSIANSNSIEELYKLIDIPLHGYWYNHTCFGGTETCGNARMKQKQIDVIIINSIAPVLYVYGKHRKEYALCGKAEEYLHSLKCEENSIVRRWKEEGVKATCAADSQALIQLSKSYCSNKKCLECQFAHVYINSIIKCL